MPTIRSKFSFEQFEDVLQKLAHKIALNAVRTLSQGRVRIIIRGNGTFSEVSTRQHCFRFYLRHASYAKTSGKYVEQFGFDVENKTYITSNHCSKISFYAPDDKREETEKQVVEFIAKIMAEASIKPVPRFALSKYTGGQRYLDLTKKTASKKSA